VGSYHREVLRIDLRLQSDVPMRVSFDDFVLDRGARLLQRGDETGQPTTTDDGD
jgi:hypothetical protein